MALWDGYETDRLPVATPSFLKHPSFFLSSWFVMLVVAKCVFEFQVNDDMTHLETHI